MDRRQSAERTQDNRTSTDRTVRADSGSGRRVEGDKVPTLFDELFERGNSLVTHAAAIFRRHRTSRAVPRLCRPAMAVEERSRRLRRQQHDIYTGA
jgi:hypothetical protein